MFLKNELLPNIEMVDRAGAVHRLWDYRQKTHLLLLFGNRASAGEAAMEAKKKTLDWLGVRVIACPLPPADLEPLAYAVDRYGRFIDAYPIDQDLAERVEKDFLYYEARHC